MNNYLPHFQDESGNTWNVLSIHFCVDFGGRQAQIEAQCKEAFKLTKTFVYFYKDRTFRQWDSEESVDCTPVHGNLTYCLRHIFETFNNGE